MKTATTQIKTIEQLTSRMVELKQLIANATTAIDYKGNETITIHIREVPDDLIHAYADAHKLHKSGPDPQINHLWCVESTPWGRIYIESEEKSYTEVFS